MDDATHSDRQFKKRCCLPTRTLHPDLTASSRGSGHPVGSSALCEKEVVVHLIPRYTANVIAWQPAGPYS